MILPIDSKYRLMADRYSWAIQQARRISRKTGEIRWESVSWFPTVDLAIKGLHNLRVRSSPAENLSEALQACEESFAEIAHALSPGFEVRELESPPRGTAGESENQGIKTRAAVQVVNRSRAKHSVRCWQLKQVHQDKIGFNIKSFIFVINCKIDLHVCSPGLFDSSLYSHQDSPC